MIIYNSLSCRSLIGDTFYIKIWYNSKQPLSGRGAVHGTTARIASLDCDTIQVESVGACKMLAAIGGARTQRSGSRCEP